jgi:hypothetical protein
MPYVDPDYGLPVLNKQPGESVRFNLPAGDRMRTGDTIASVDSVTAAAVDAGSGTVTVSGEVADGTDVQATYAGGTDGEKYKVEATITTTGGDTIEVDAMLYVND